MRITILAFAGLRELIGSGARTVELPGGSTAGDAWNALARGNAGLEGLTASTRIARNGRVVAFDEPLADGDEVALLPPVGGG